MKRIGLFLLVMVVGVFGAWAQSDTLTIAPDETVEGELTVEQPFNYYQLTASAGDLLGITLRSGDFDAYLVLTDSTGEVVAEDDDSGGRLDAMIRIEIPADDTYTIAATSFRAHRSEGQMSAGGAYVLTVERLTDVISDQPTDDDSVFAPFIVYGDVVSGTIAEGETASEYLFSASAGDLVTVTLRSTDFDAYLLLQDENGNTLTEDDDSAGSLDSLISDFEIRQSGVYRLVATSFGAVRGFTPGTGDYTLSLEVASASDEPPVMSDDFSLNYGDFIEGRLTRIDPTLDYRLEGAAGDVVVITLRSNDFDAYLEMFDSSGELVTFDDDSAGGLDSRIGPYALPADDVYTVRVNSYGNVIRGDAGVGLFTLEVESIELGELIAGETINDVLSPRDNFAAYRLTGEAGQIIIIDFETDDMSVYASLAGNGLEIFAYPGETDMLGPATLPADGDYVLMISTFGAQYDIEYTITLRDVAAQSIAYDTPTTSNFDESPINVFTFAAQAGDMVNVRVDSGGAVDTTLVLNAPGGWRVAFDDMSGPGFDPELYNIYLPEDGDYTLVVATNITGDNADYTLLIERDGVRELDVAPQIIRLDSNRINDFVIFDATAGQTVRLTVRKIGGDRFNEPFIDVRQGDEVIASNMIGQVESLTMTFTVPEDGRVLVEAYNYYGTAILELALEDAG
ncbi:MAG: hypothetical protein EA396_11410 [Anaerolineaceae bacterium]|nr:MAG: hypothetical protein EA396_11410 [Anaerolineaceae bacterium]